MSAGRDANAGSAVRLSVVVPMFNEEENVAPLCAEVRAALAALEGGWELVIVDDASTDGTRGAVEREAAADARVRLVSRPVRRGQSAALCAGFAAVRGGVVGTLDGDLQSDPCDLPVLLAALERDGADMVTGWRARRHDHLVRRISSRIANRTRDLLTGDRITDVGCATRVFRRGCLAGIPCFFDGMHRFFPTLLRMAGYRVEEAPVNHRPRVRGVAKYGVWNRLGRGIRDLFGVRWLRDRHLSEGRDVLRNVVNASDGSGRGAVGSV